MLDKGVWPFWRLMLELVFYQIKHRKQSETRCGTVLMTTKCKHPKTKIGYDDGKHAQVL